MLRMKKKITHKKILTQKDIYKFDMKIYFLR